MDVLHLELEIVLLGVCPFAFLFGCVTFLEEVVVLKVLPDFNEWCAVVVFSVQITAVLLPETAVQFLVLRVPSSLLFEHASRTACVHVAFHLLQRVTLC